MKKKKEDKEAEFATWAMTDSSRWRRGWRKRVRNRG
jgi:hypothetical protein